MKHSEFYIQTPAQTFQAVYDHLPLPTVPVKFNIFKTSLPFVKIDVTDIDQEGKDSIFKTLKSASVLTIKNWV